MNQEVYSVEMGEYMVAESPAILVTSGIGSCIAICLYDRTLKIGAMAHAMLPEKTDNHDDSPLKFVDQVIPEMIKQLNDLNSDNRNIIAKIVGGANMFTTLGEYAKEIGEKNTEVAIQILKKYGIQLAAESTGGTVGRGVEFDMASGVVSIVSKI